MRYTGMSCQACGKIFEETDDVVCCPVCGAPHHRACWLEQGKCASNDRHSQGYVWEMPHLQSAAEPEQKETTEPGKVKFPDGTSSVTCPHCGAENFPDDIFCRACHEQIKKDSLFDFSAGHRQDDSDSYYSNEGGNGDYGNRNTDYRRENMYNAYTVFGGLDPDSMIDDIPVREYVDYIGNNSGSYVRKFSIAEHFQKKTIWNWAAAIFGPIWFFFRKQAKIGAIMCAVLIALSVVAGVLSMSDATMEYVTTVIQASREYSAGLVDGSVSAEEATEELNAIFADALAQYNAADNTPREIASLVLESLMTAGTVIFSGIYGNYCYKKKAKKEILDSREKCTDAQSYRLMLASRGGVSAGFAVIGVLLTLAAIILLTYFPYIYVLFFK